MRRLSPEEIREPLSNDQIVILADMMAENPVSIEWIQCAQKLTDEQRFLIYEMMGELRERREKERKQSLSQEEQEAEEIKKRKWFENLDPLGFYGNMGQPETPQEYKNRYGTWPPGYDKNGNKIGK